MGRWLSRGLTRTTAAATCEGLGLCGKAGVGGGGYGSLVGTRDAAARDLKSAGGLTVASAVRRRWTVALSRLARMGLREPIIVVLFLAGVFTLLAGRHVHGALLLVVSAGLGWDAVRTVRRDEATLAGGVVEAGPAGQAEEWLGGAPQARWRRLLTFTALVAAGALYAVVVGIFARYSWPATAAVAVLAAAVVVAFGWRAPRRPRRDPGKLPARGAALWAGWLVAAGVWELVAYFQQPSLTAVSYAHPTISALVDPLLVSHPGRTGALAVWLAIGWFLVRR